MSDNTRQDWEDQRPDKNDTRADISEARADVAEARADKAQLDWNSLSDNVGKRAKVAEARATRTEIAATKLRTTIAIVIATISIGCAAGIYLVNKHGVDRSNRNACVLRALVDVSLENAPPGASKTAGYKDFVRLRTILRPPEAECISILK